MPKKKLRKSGYGVFEETPWLSGRGLRVNWQSNKKEATRAKARIQKKMKYTYGKNAPRYSVKSIWRKR